MFSIAIAGRLPQDDRLIQRLSAQVEQIQALTAAEGKQTGLRIEISPSYASEQWCALVRSWGYPVFGYEGAGGPAWGEMFDRVVRIENTRRDSLGEILCDQADILLAVWNEDIGELDGATWELMRIALKSRVPCIWISTRNGQRYWQDKTVYDTFEEHRLAQLVSVAVNPETEPVRCGDREIPMLFMPRFLYNRYIRRYRAARRIVDTRQDTILEPDCPLAQVSPEAEAMRKQLVGQFRRFDQQAIACNERYQSVLYWRAILPLIATLFIVLGFYGGSVLAAIPGISKKTWEIIAGCGFLCHALVNLYVFILSRSRRVRAYQSGMIKNRQMAEMLRMLIHFAPFGMRTELSRLCGEDRRLCASLRHMLRQAEPKTGRLEVNRANVVEAFRHMDELLADQIEYHRRSYERYSRLVAHLERWSVAAFYIGFAVVLLRAALQFAYPLFGVNLPAFEMDNKVMSGDFIKSFSNMLALLLPAWHSLFASKLSLCNFRFNRDNHRRMQQLLSDEQDNFERLQAMLDVAPTEVLRSITESLKEIITTQDTSVWVRQYDNTRIEHL